MRACASLVSAALLGGLATQALANGGGSMPMPSMQSRQAMPRTLTP